MFLTNIKSRLSDLCKGTLIKSLDYLSARRFGPLMSLHFGNVPVHVVSSADTAREITKTHDLIFINRPKRIFFQILLYDYKDVVSARYGEYWRQMRSICVLNLLSNKRVQSYRAIREEKTALAVKNVQKSSSSGLLVNLSELFLMTLNNDVGDYLPWLAWVSHVNGFNAKAKKVAKEFDEFLDEHENHHNKQVNYFKGIQGKDQKDFCGCSAGDSKAKSRGS
ncbi:Cytochrome P450 71A1 [Hibiscus syriacus]|uniref:Cytochrome P450 71A1 n=1 Tax=Hibiscus syriacus TaxID=106335 RepID=A0A6A2XBE0_HIBSY|nr:cytochrome P450 736A117-like [Hibiscus syriacus]KAE8672562.1 Cytochrome P450 71A1 [Hibiscus syriacus]